MGVGAPSGTVTFLFTDIEGSTGLWQKDESAMRAALERHDSILRSTVDGRGGYVFSTGGDGFGVAFARAGDAVAAAVDAQSRLAEEPWPEGAPIRVRMGLHTGEVTERDGDYFGTPVNKTARLMAVGHGGQVLVSAVTAGLVGVDVKVVDLGEHRLRDLSGPTRVFQVRAEGLPLEFPPLRTLDAFPGNLPLQVSSFIGRELVLARGLEALRSSRVVTLTGVGGVGKTRLALQLAAAALPGFRDGAWLVELAPVRDPAGVADAVVSVFGVSTRAGQSAQEAVVEFLRTKRMVVVLDNCEHVLDAVAGLVDGIERSCAGVVVLATSREGLALDGERVLPVPSLSLPDVGADLPSIARSDAVSLFLERAERVDPDFALDSGNASAVAAVCRRLDGVPLAIELAAARVRAMTPAELARGLDRRFETLSGGRRGAVQRHQTLRAAIDWSYDLLTEPERCLLARLSVFAGGCTRQSVEAVCGGDPIEVSKLSGLLSGLVDRSLVVADRGGPDTRYRFLETIREYGEERLAEHGETAAMRLGHGGYYLNLARRLFEEADGPGEVEALRRLQPEHENLLAALANAVDTGDVDTALGLFTAHWGHAGLAVFLPRFPVDALGLDAAAEHRLYPAALATAAYIAAQSGDARAPERLCGAALEAAERLGAPDPFLDWSTQEIIGGALSVNGAYAAAAAHYERAVEAARSAGLPAALPWSLTFAAYQHVLIGDRGRALPFAAEGLRLARRLGRPDLIANALGALSGALAEPDPEQAKELLREGVRLTASFADVGRVLSPPTALFTAAAMGDWGQALDLAASLVSVYHWTRARTLLGAALTVVARAIVPVDAEASARLQGAARRLMAAEPSEETAMPEMTAAGPAGPRAESPSRNAGLVTDLYRQAGALLRDALGEARLRELRAEGQALDDDQVVALARDAITRALARA